MDLVANIQRVVVLMAHNSKDGTPKLVNKCSLPLTGINVVDRVITDFGVFDNQRLQNIFNKERGARNCRRNNRKKLR